MEPKSVVVMGKLKDVLIDADNDIHVILHKETGTEKTIDVLSLLKGRNLYIKLEQLRGWDKRNDISTRNRTS